MGIFLTRTKKLCNYDILLSEQSRAKLSMEVLTPIPGDSSTVITAAAVAAPGGKLAAPRPTLGVTAHTSHTIADIAIATLHWPGCSHGYSALAVSQKHCCQVRGEVKKCG